MRQERIDASQLELNEKVVSIKRVTKVAKAVNLMLRPPLTTLVTRLIDTTFSFNSN